MPETLRKFRNQSLSCGNFVKNPSTFPSRYTFYQIITYIRVPMRCARTAVGLCTDPSPWVRLCGEELFNFSVFSTAFVTVSLFVFLFCFFFFVDELHQVSSGFMPEFLGCCDMSLCSAEQTTSGRVLSRVSFRYNVFYTYLRPRNL